MTEINPGDVRRVSGSFTNPAGVATDPTTISVRWRHHRGTETTWVYGTDTQVVRDSAGVFHADIPITVSGLYYYKFEGTGAVQAAEEGTFLAETFFEAVVPSTPSGPIRLYTGTADPTTGAGVPAAIGSVYSRTLLGSESVWVKTGAADTAWVQSGSAGGGVAGLTITDGVTSVTATSLRMPSGTVVDVGGGVAAVGLVVTLLGPFHVNYNAAGIDVLGVPVATLDEGTLVLKAWLVVTAPFLVGGTESGHSAFIGLGPDSGNLTNYETNFAIPGEGPAIAGQEAHSDTPITHNSQFVAAGGQPLTVAVYPASGSFTAGGVDCYAVIATPAV
jgi:hypothetical protein